MTRDEAVKIIAKRFSSPDSFGASWADVFSALGMLKIDEPKTPTQKFEKAMKEEGYSYMDITASGVLRIIDAAGLKIVEK